ncbi:UNVERIFIED_CONTAM: hypothetical protein GTU68_026970 [Idotea baltica]|nr:hypothetical protein [Idotea baltica]
MEKTIIRKPKVYSSGLVVAAGIAQYLFEQISQVDKINIAVSGGSTPRLLFSILSEVYGKKIDWKKVSLFWVDERCVAPTDNQSNYKMTSHHLLDAVSIPQGNVHRVFGENEPENEAVRYSELIESNLPTIDGVPIFDVVLLGMGDDGHTASIFPPDIDLLDSSNTCAVGVHPESGQKRITLTGRVINAASQIHFLVAGKGKRKVVAEIFGNEPEAQKYPAAYIDNAIWWMDTDAFE